MAKRKNRIKKNLKMHSSKVQEAPVNYDQMPPIFSLERLQNTKYCFSSLDKTDKAAFSDAIFKRKTVCWNDIKKSDRHALGFEKINKNSIKPGLPTFITSDMEYVLAFRFNGKKPMVGYRQKNIFYVLWFDHDFTLYNH